jgi:hypothetical protein
LPRQFHLIPFFDRLLLCVGVCSQHDILYFP